MGAYKTSLPWWKIVLLGAVAGCYVGLGGALLLTGEAGAAARVERPRASKRRPTLFRRLSHPRPPRPTRLCPSPVGPNCPGIASSNPGLAKYITGAIGFPFALLQILVRVCMGSCACARVGVSVQAPTLCTRTPSPPPHPPPPCAPHTQTCGAELFTGNTALCAAAVFEGKATMRGLLKSWTCSYLGNIIGCSLSLLLFANSGLMPQVGGGWGGGVCCSWWAACAVQGGLAPSRPPRSPRRTPRPAPPHPRARVQFTAGASALAVYKTAAPLKEVVIKAIAANWFVCLAVWQVGLLVGGWARAQVCRCGDAFGGKVGACPPTPSHLPPPRHTHAQATAANTFGGKFIACLGPVSAFVCVGLEHCIANMFFVPLGILVGGGGSGGGWVRVGGGGGGGGGRRPPRVMGPARPPTHPPPVPRAPPRQVGAPVDMGAFLTKNLIPVTLGNIFAGVVCVATVYSLIYGGWAGGWVGGRVDGWEWVGGWAGGWEGVGGWEWVGGWAGGWTRGCGG